MKAFVYCLSLFSLFLFSFEVKSQGTAEDTTRVLFIGNSFTYFNNMPQLFEQLALQANHPVKIMQHTPGGVSVGDISQGTMAHMNNPAVYQYLRNYKWDFLVLQDNQGRFVLDYGVFPSASLVVKGHKMIRDSLLHYSPCAKVLWFAGWGWKNGYLPYSATGSGIIDRIYRNYTVLLDSAGQTIAPIGAAWKTYIASTNPVNLWDVDDTHPSFAGSLLTAHVIYSSVFKTSATESAFTTTALPYSVDTLFRRIAFNTVIDSASSCHFNLITPTLVCTNGSCSATNASSIKWYSNGQLIAQGPTYTASATIKVQAIVTCSNGCTLRSYAYTLSKPLGSGVVEQSKTTVGAIPNPFSNTLYINTIGRYKLLSMLGTTVLEGRSEQEQHVLSTEQLQPGSYILQLFSEQGAMLQQTILVKTAD